MTTDRPHIEISHPALLGVRFYLSEQGGLRWKTPRPLSPKDKEWIVSNRVELIQALRNSGRTRADTGHSQAVAIINEAHRSMEAEYFSLSDPWIRRSVRDALANDPNIIEAETAISAEANILRDSEVPPERKMEAFRRVVEGMDYWQKLIAAKMRRDGKAKTQRQGRGQ